MLQSLDVDHVRTQTFVFRLTLTSRTMGPFDRSRTCPAPLSHAGLISGMQVPLVMVDIRRFCYTSSSSWVPFSSFGSIDIFTDLHDFRSFDMFGSWPIQVVNFFMVSNMGVKQLRG
jgi:hypothetical protein